MKASTLLIITFVFANLLSGQTKLQQYPKKISTPTNFFKVEFSNVPGKINMDFNKYDTLDMGTDGAPGLKATIYFGDDSLAIPYTNFPYTQIIFVPVQSPNRTITYKLHFNEVWAYFPDSYIIKNEGNIQLNIPEVYELANILWALSPTGQRKGDLDKTSPYYQKVVTYFKPFLGHAIFKKLDFSDSLYFDKYYDFRENSFAFDFVGDSLVENGPYHYVMGEDRDHNSLFKQLKPLIEDFAKQTSFSVFYKENSSYYAHEIKREEELLPVRSMWEWLENQFPVMKIQSYRIVFSPLIGGSHSTQVFRTFQKKRFFTEIVMFICGTGRYEKMLLTEKQKEGLMSGIVFTEIDHNYVNPTSQRYIKAIDSTFSNRDVWTLKGGDNGNYGSAVAVFNEYMTHAVFCLWVMSRYEKSVAEFVIKNRIDLMVNKRGFIKFKEFTQQLIKLSQKNKKAVELYPGVLEWCKTQTT